MLAVSYYIVSCTLGW